MKMRVKLRAVISIRTMAQRDPRRLGWNLGYHSPNVFWLHLHECL
ncbi:hypothetical protein NC653_026679 [Populus alba x Populus x berolinensis]|uniref:Uncharacterized protein n=1 Tax=Populus alba x Populus x berolinensis TaxID=444605 RepID=A0AAD6MF06_9ROSI|nr:hypothetical protein NC653_026679 [Populus alba x Populus x berolinensis]